MVIPVNETRVSKKNNWKDILFVFSLINVSQCNFQFIIQKQFSFMFGIKFIFFC